MECEEAIYSVLEDLLYNGCDRRQASRDNAASRITPFPVRPDGQTGLPMQSGIIAEMQNPIVLALYYNGVCSQPSPGSLSATVPINATLLGLPLPLTWSHGRVFPDGLVPLSLHRRSPLHLL